MAKGFQVAFTAPEVRILVVDDNHVNLKVAEGILKAYQMNVDTADSGEHAIEMAERYQYDLILMDHMMPEMNGVDTAKRIRGMQGKRFQEVPIIALSADDSESVRTMFLEAGMNDYASKPIERRTIDTVLCRWLPKDKVIPSEDAEEKTETKEEKNNQKKQEECSPAEWHMEGIDVAAGMEYFGNNETTYREVLSDYMDNIEERAKTIEQAVSESNIETYVIETHSLKSTSKSIGALALSQLAEELEACGKSGEWETIVAKTPTLLSMYRDLYDAIAPYRIAKEENGEKKVFCKDEILSLLGRLHESMDAYDSAQGEELLKELSKYGYEQKWLDYRDKISKAIGRFDYDICKETIREWKEALHSI